MQIKNQAKDIGSSVRAHSALPFPNIFCEDEVLVFDIKLRSIIGDTLNYMAKVEFLILTLKHWLNLNS